jgi:hypothetical protein
MTKNNIVRHKENPYLQELNVTTRSKNIKVTKLGKQDDIRLTNHDTGEMQGTYIGTTKRVDSEQFLKLFTSNIAMTFDLKAAGIKALNVVMYVMQTSAIEKDVIYLDKIIIDEFNEEHKKKLSKTVFYKGVTELINAKILARTIREGQYFINPNFVFNGDRIVFSTIIEKKEEEQQELDFKG